MRKIPIYDTSDPNQINNHILEWDTFVNRENIKGYCKKIRKIVNCKPIAHLEISQNSPIDFGREVRTASLELPIKNKIYSAESIYQGSKSFPKSGQQNWLYEYDGEYALKTKAKWKGRSIKEISIFGNIFPVNYLSVLHDIVYWLGLENNKKNIRDIMGKMDKSGINYFTDCFDSIGKNSQAKSFAKYYWTFKNGESVWDNLTDDENRILFAVKNESKKEESYLF